MTHIKFLKIYNYWLNKSQNRRIDFIIIGAQKSGTTALYEFLNQHPDISMSNTKEVDFFSYNYNLENNYRKYHCYFNFNNNSLLYGEASPSYMLEHKTTAQRIKEYNPSIKLIILLKNPIDRCYSQYKMHVNKHGFNKPFIDCIKLAMLNKHTKVFLNNKNKNAYVDIDNYLNFGHYSSQIKGFMNHFPSENMLFLKTEDLMASHTETMKKTLKFLNIEYYDIPTQIIHSYGNSKMTDNERQTLNEYYCDEITELERLLGLGFTNWLN